MTAVDEVAGRYGTPGPLLRVVKRQALAFAVVGAANTALGIGLTVLWLTVTGGEHPGLAVAGAYSVSLVVAFVLHRTLVFRVRGRVLRDFVAFCGVNAGGLALNIAGLEVAVTGLGLPARPAAVLVMGLVAVLSWFGHRHLSFRRAPAR